ncbi:4-(cytidine 5'-diphospho)-2-C-methyl-D-erythritol kinase [Sphingomonas sp. 10B4]|uniref:4-(cytidine 5'-diphospho)-2-C-methyl-D-erythritol kinase n=1 Tax=unclassified Sphingomonas TaxID=196159 RepID=UPI002AB3E0B2|nr:4-(cytidine 5'-diphospho)-2-C-methyl-D-erythritol kinase [Sphingomonas sp. 10B4]MDY7525941.1 4-(cytidine 5'-diphospho)-2-C-methyl-D-erythritol kinase [Sphingomonas sp. 10B4]MEB0284143.1 4-(cytidine 5'-diphospho)-2-C-methyl-D-erythritol kinase [Sphingomonas sp. 10B4]
MITETAPAKINLALHVRARRGDGYHELETLFAFVADGDTVTLAPGPLSLAITGPFSEGLSGEGDNLVLRAARAFATAFDLPEGGAFTLDKHLPVASGIGGGSADAAAALRALARANAIAIDDPKLFDIAAALGSDVPACLLGRTALGQGRGERLVPLDGPAGMPVLLVNPGVAVSTAAVFKAWDGVDLGAMPEGDVLDVALAARNDLEPPARRLAPEIDGVLALLAEGTPLLARMSGSGATCFALYATTAERSAAAARIRAAQPGYWCLETTLA